MDGPAVALRHVLAGVPGNVYCLAMASADQPEFEQKLREILDSSTGQRESPSGNAQKPSVERESDATENRQEPRGPIPRWVEVVVRVLAALAVAWLLLLFALNVASR